MDRHDLDATSLIAGLLFVAIGGLFLLDRVDAIALEVRWIWPLLLIGLGIAGLASSRPWRTDAGDAPDRPT
jgi:hypothetical protein